MKVYFEEGPISAALQYTSARHKKTIFALTSVSQEKYQQRIGKRKGRIELHVQNIIISFL